MMEVSLETGGEVVLSQIIKAQPLSSAPLGTVLSHMRRQVPSASQEGHMMEACRSQGQHLGPLP